MALAKCRECGHEVSSGAKVCPKCGVAKPVARRSLVYRLMLGFVGLVVIGGVVGGLTSPKDSTGLATQVVPIQKSPKEAAIEAVLLEKSDWRTGGFDTVMLFSAKLRNTGAADVKDLKIECTLFSNSGTPLSRVRAVVYELLKAGRSISVKELNMGFINTQSTRAQCAVVDLTVL